MARAVVTLRQVAERAGVHPGTASRALNPETRNLVSAATVKRVLEAAEHLKYQPNPLARGLKTSRSMTVGIIVPDLTNPLFPPIVRAAEEVLGREGYIGLIADTDNVPEAEEKHFRSLQARHVDGFILASAYLNDATIVSAAELGIPAVLVNRRDEDSRLPAVVGDDERGIRDAVRHLQALGHRRIAHLTGPMTLSTGRSRSIAFQRAVSELGLEVSPDLVVEADAYSIEAGLVGGRQLLAQARPTAVVCGNDLIALGFIDAAAQAGLSVPADVSVVGFNDILLMDRLKPALTTLSVPLAQMGAAAARVVLDAIQRGTNENTTITFPVDLKVRESTAPPPLHRK